MGQYEPNDSRDVTHGKSVAGEPPRTGANEGAAHQAAQGNDRRDDKAEPAGRPDDEKVDKDKQQFGYGDRNDGIKDGAKPKGGAPGAAKQAGENSDDPDHDPLLVDEPQDIARADAQRPLQQS